MSEKTSLNPVERRQSQLRRDLRLAMTARRADEASLLRCLLAAIDNAQAVPVGDLHERNKYAAPRFGDGTAEAPRLELSAGEIDRLLLRERQDRIDAADQCEQVGRSDRATALRAEAEIVKRYVEER
jgi:uncharacterized protein YqeY